MAEPTNTPAAAGAVEEASKGWSIYKPGQAYWTRTGTVIGVSAISLLGILWMWDYAKTVRLGAVNPLYVATAAALVVGTAITAFTYYLVFVKPRSVDFLVATEGEMKKVNWSTRREVVGSTTAVVVTAAVLALFCWGLEIIFVWFFQLINVLKS